MIHKIVLPTKDGWEDFRQNLGFYQGNLLCFTKEAQSYDKGPPSQIHFIGAEGDVVIYIPSFLELDMVLAQAPEVIFLVDLSDDVKQNLKENWNNPEILRAVILEEYGLT